MTTSKKHQAGFSIISLMIASAIGIFIIGGAGKVYIDSRNTFNARTAVAAATENYRFAFQDIRRALVMAGRGVSASDDGNDSYQGTDSGLRTFPAVDNVPDGIVSGATAGGSPWSPDPEDSSVVAIRYASGPAPCGVAVAEFTDTLTVRFLVNDEGNLICQVYRGATQLTSQPLVSGIVQMRVLYGIDTDTDDPDGVANQFLTANEVGEARWPAVVSIRIGLIVQSGDDIELPNTFRPDDLETLDLLGKVFTAPDTNNVYKSASTTISLRNLHHVDRQPSDN
ncbi:MAG: PilW family protein [Candidatus Thiodiazotropha endolucinida]